MDEVKEEQAKRDLLKVTVLRKLTRDLPWLDERATGESIKDQISALETHLQAEDSDRPEIGLERRKLRKIRRLMRTHFPTLLGADFDRALQILKEWREEEKKDILRSPERLSAITDHCKNLLE